MSEPSSQVPRTAGVIVIGDELLRGQVLDTNSNFIARHLFDIGVRVVKVSIIGDDEEVISNEVRCFSKDYTYVLTTGGIGPTHDDVTFKAVGMAFDEPLFHHPELVKICSELFSTDDLNSPEMKLAHVPKSARLIFGYDELQGKRTLFPNVVVRNVYIFPGIPPFMERLFTAIYKQLFGGSEVRYFTKNLYLTSKEVTIAKSLNSVVDKYPDCIFGSYPEVFNRYYQVQITVQSRLEKQVEAAFQALKAAVPEDSIVEYDCNPLEDAYNKITRMVDGKENPNFKSTVTMIDNLCNNYKPDELCVFMSADKESIAVLHLLHAFIRKQGKDSVIHAVRVIEDSSLAGGEDEDYINVTGKRYKTSTQVLMGPIDVVLPEYLASQSHIKAVIFGCPKDICNKEEKMRFMKTCEKCTLVKWVNILENWTSTEVWVFIRSLFLPYCTSYDQDSKKSEGKFNDKDSKKLEGKYNDKDSKKTGKLN